MDFAEYKDNAKENKVTLSEDDFVRYAAEALADDQGLNELMRRQPTLFMVLAIYSERITKKIFYEGNTPKNLCNKQEE